MLVTGGSLPGHCETKNTAEIFDPATGRSRPTRPMRDGRNTRLSQLPGDGRVLVAGGWTRPVQGCNSDGAIESASQESELFDPLTETWSRTGSLVVARAGNSVFTRLLDGRVVYGGGRTPNPGQATDRTRTAEVYDPLIGTWSPLPDMAAAHTGGEAVLLDDGRVLVVAGGPAFRLAEILTP